MMCTLSSYITVLDKHDNHDNHDEVEVFQVTPSQEASFSSLSSVHAMSVGEYLYPQKKRAKKNQIKSSKSKIQEDSVSETKKSSSTKKKSKKAIPRSENPEDSWRESDVDQSISDSIAESHQTAPARIQNTPSSVLAGPPAEADGHRSMSSILDDIRHLRAEAEKDCDKVKKLKDLWQDDASRLLQKWEDQKKERMLRKQSLLLPRRSRRQITPPSS